MQSPQTWYIVFTAVTAAAVLLQACVLLGMLLALLQMRKKMLAITERVEQQVLPIVSTVRQLVEDTTPKLKTATEHLVEVCETLRLQARNVNATVDDVVGKTKVQTARVDEMVTNALNTVAQATAALHHAVSVPMRQVTGVLNGLRAGVDTLRSKDRPVARSGDGERYI